MVEVMQKKNLIYPTKRDYGARLYGDSMKICKFV